MQEFLSRPDLWKYAIEWFVAPLVMFVFLFKWRDELNILHMPWADLVAIIVVADIALALNAKEMPAFFLALHGYKSDYNHSPWSWGLLAVAGVAICRFQVKVLEDDIESIAIKQVSVGWGHKPPYPGAARMSKGEAFRSFYWRRFTLLWAASVSLTILIVAAHSVVIGMALPSWGVQSGVVNEIMHVVALTAIAFAGAVLLCILFVGADIFRVYPPPPRAG
jgi:hypothetical protein